MPVYDTVHRCLQPGRTRLDVELVVDIARALLGSDNNTAEWRHACQVIEGTAGEAAVVDVACAFPDDLPAFVGRRTALQRVRGAAAGGSTVIAVSGMPGLGKSSFAVHAAHRLVDDGQYGDLRLSVDLRAHDPSRPPADPSAALDGFLRRLGVRAGDIQLLDLDRRTARYRELVAGRQVVLLLDDAASEDQVLPLLPNDPTCLVIITSRRRLAIPGAEQVALDTFTPSESLDLLRTATNAELIDAEPEAAARIPELCGYLPLAVAVVAGRIRTTVGWTMSDHVDRLVERRDRLRPDDTVAMALTSSYLQLAADEQRLLRLLALHPGHDIDAHAAAALLDSDLADAARLLAGLEVASLARQRTAGRFGLHDLIRTFAADRVHEDEPSGALQAANARLLDHYRFAAVVAMDQYAPEGAARRPRPADPGTPMPSFDDRESAARWLESERANLLAIAVHAGNHGAAAHTSDLSVILFRFLDAGAHHQDAILLHSVAAQVARGSIRGRALGGLGITCWRLGRYEEALTHYSEALAVQRELGDTAGEGSTLTNLGVTYARLGRWPEAIEHFQRAIAIHRIVGNRTAEADTHGNLGDAFAHLGDLEAALEQNQLQLALAREIGHRAAEGVALSNIGEVFRRLGRLPAALDHHERALTIAREIGYREGEVQALNSLGADLQVLGRQQEAIERHTEALASAAQLAGRYELARAHDGLARAHIALADVTTARRHWRRAQAIYTELGTPEADDIPAGLAAIDAVPAQDSGSGSVPGFGSVG